MNNLKLSILMANYNNGRFIKEAINSVIRQTYQNWELIIVDDASTDNSIAVIKEFVNDKRIKLFRHDTNKGCGAVKRECAARATGEIFSVLDPDDTLDKTALEIVVKAYISNPGHGFIYSDLNQCDMSLNIIGRLDWVGKYDKEKTNLIEPRVSAFRTFTREAYNKTAGFDPGLKSAVDKDIIYKLEEVTRLKYIDQQLYNYRFHKEGIASLGRNSEKARISEYVAKYNAYNRRRGTNIPNYSKKEMADLMYEGVIRSLLYDTNKVGWFARRALNLNPNILRIIVVLFNKIKKKLV